MKLIWNLPRNTVQFLRSIWIELNQVEWLGFSDVAKNTIIVLIFVVLIVVVLMSMDSALVTVREFLYDLKVT